MTTTYYKHKFPTSTRKQILLSLSPPLGINFWLSSKSCKLLAIWGLTACREWGIYGRKWERKVRRMMWRKIEMGGDSWALFGNNNRVEGFQIILVWVDGWRCLWAQSTLKQVPPYLYLRRVHPLGLTVGSLSTFNRSLDVGGHWDWVGPSNTLLF